MFRLKPILVAAALVAALPLSACYDYDGGGYSDVSLGYGVVGGYGSGYNSYYSGYAGDPYWGWYGDYYYPGTGYYVYGRDNRRYRWNATQQGYWQGRGRAWRGDRRSIRPVWGDYRGNGQGYRGAYGQPGRPGGYRNGTNRPRGGVYIGPERQGTVGRNPGAVQPSGNVYRGQRRSGGDSSGSGRPRGGIYGGAGRQGSIGPGGGAGRASGATAGSRPGRARR